MEDRGGKTIMCSVLFLDIVEYSKRSVSGQISLKDRFNSYLSEAIKHVPAEDRIILDTGDGAAINFLGDVEDALKAALSLRDSILNEGPNQDPPLLVRAGINLGPVRLVRDINGQPNIVGDGINVAQRIMGFAEADQILVSRSYFDAVSNLSPQYAGMFKYQGSRTDKHVREHEVYAIGHLGEKTAELIATNLHEIQRVKLQERIAAAIRNGWNAAVLGCSNAVGQMKERFAQADPKQRAVYVGMAALPVVLAGALVLKLTVLGGETPALPDDAAQVLAESGVAPASAVEAASAVAASAVPQAASAVASAVPATVQTAAKPEAKKPIVQDMKKTAKPEAKKVAEDKSDTKKTTEHKTDSGTTDHVKHASEQPGAGDAKQADEKTLLEKIKGGIDPGKEAYLSIRCAEGTQIFVDGKDNGKVLPSGLTVAATPGKHKIIVTSKKGELYAKDVELVSGKTLSVKPNFCE